MTDARCTQWIHYVADPIMPSVETGYRGEDGKPVVNHQRLDRHQAATLATACGEMVRRNSAKVTLFAFGWTIYPQDHIEDVASLWI